MFAVDSAYHSGGVNFDEGGKVVNCTGGNEYAMLDHPLERGKATIVWKLERDSANGECSCFGLAIRPVTNNNYERSNQMWMYRCYNGNLYARGRNLNRPLDKVHPGDTVTVKVDMDAGTAMISRNGAPFRAAWDDLKGHTVYPTVAFYSSNRAIRVVSIEMDAQSSDSSAIPIVQLAPVAAQAKEGKFTTDAMTIGGGGDGGKANKALRPTTAICMRVNLDSSGEVREVTVPVTDPTLDTFKATVGLACTSSASGAEFQGSVKFSLLYNDTDTELWTGTLDKAKAVAEVKVHLPHPMGGGGGPGAASAPVCTLRLRVEGTGVGTLWRAVWADPTLQAMPWAWEYEELEKAGSPIVAATASRPTSFEDLGRRTLLLLQLYANEALRSMRNTKPPVRWLWGSGRSEWAQWVVVACWVLLGGWVGVVALLPLLCVAVPCASAVST